MADCLIVYETSEGQTAKIADEIARTLTELGHGVTEVRPDDEVPALSAYDAVIVGSPIHIGVHDPKIVQWVEENREALERTHSAFFSVSLAQASHDPSGQEAAKRMVDEFIAKVGWRPDLVACFAGALAYSQYGFVKKMIMKRIARKEGGDVDTSRDYEYTDWDRVHAFAADVVGSIEAE